MIEELKIMPVTTMQGIINAWPVISKGMEKVMGYNNGNETMESVFNEITSGQCSLWIAFMDNKYIGFFTIIIKQPLNGDRYLLIHSIYSKKPVSKESWITGLNKIEEIAKKAGCKRISMYTLRDKAFNRKLAPFGWKQGYVEFIKEV